MNIREQIINKSLYYVLQKNKRRRIKYRIKYRRKK